MSAAQANASANGSSSNGSRSAGDIGIPDALLERMMDRKLRMLDMEYEECVRATKGWDMKDYDSGPVGDEEDAAAAKPDAETVKQFGYAPFGGETAAVGSMPVESAPADDEWSEAWAEYKRDCAEEAAEAARLGLTDDSKAEPEQPEQPAPKPKPLTDADAAKIRGVMANIRLKPPPWARNVPEEVWMAQILQRAGLRGIGGPAAAPAASASPAANGAAASSAAAAQRDAERKLKHKLKKKKRAAKVAAAAAAASAAASSPSASSAAADSASSTGASASAAAAAADDDFETHFPPVSAAAPAQTNGSSVAAASPTDDTPSEQLQTPD